MKEIILGLVLSLSSLGVEAHQMEVLRGVVTGPSGVTIQVDSGGCTGKGSFELQYLAGPRLELYFIRTHEDLCQVYLEHGVTLRYTWEELGYNSFYIGNPVDPGRLGPQVFVPHDSVD